MELASPANEGNNDTWMEEIEACLLSLQGMTQDHDPHLRATEGETVSLIPAMLQLGQILKCLDSSSERDCPTLSCLLADHAQTIVALSVHKNMHLSYTASKVLVKSTLINHGLLQMYSSYLLSAMDSCFYHEGVIEVMVTILQALKSKLKSKEPLSYTDIHMLSADVLHLALELSTMTNFCQDLIHSSCIPVRFYGVILKLFSLLSQHIISDSSRNETSCVVSLKRKVDQVAEKVPNIAMLFCKSFSRLGTELKNHGPMVKLMRYFFKSLLVLFDIHAKMCCHHKLDSVARSMEDFFLDSCIISTLTICPSHFALVQSSLLNSSGLVLNTCSARDAILLAAKLICNNLQNGSPQEGVRAELLFSSMVSFIYKFPCDHSKTLSKVERLVEVFADEDDQLVSILQVLLEIYQLFRSPYRLESVPNASHVEDLNPHSCFNALLRSLSYDESVLLDWLISRESAFRLYLTNYLMYLSSDFMNFATVWSTRSCLSLRNVLTEDLTISEDMHCCMESLNLEPVLQCFANEGRSAPGLVCYSSSDEEDNLQKYSLDSVVHAKMKDDEDDSCLSLDKSKEGSGAGSATANVVTQRMSFTEDFMSALIRLRLKVQRVNEKTLVSFPLDDIILLLEEIEDKYERSGLQ